MNATPKRLPPPLPATAAELRRLRKRPLKPKRSVAYHEAGHAVAALLHDVLDHVEIGPFGGGHAACRESPNDWVHAIITLAGPVAEARFSRRQARNILIGQDDGDGSDYAQARAVLHGDAIQIGRLIGETKLLVAEHWPTIEAVAEALLRRRQMCEAEVWVIAREVAR